LAIIYAIDFPGKNLQVLANDEISDEMETKFKNIPHTYHYLNQLKTMILVKEKNGNYNAIIMSTSSCAILMVLVIILLFFKQYCYHY